MPRHTPNFWLEGTFLVFFIFLWGILLQIAGDGFQPFKYWFSAKLGHKKKQKKRDSLRTSHLHSRENRCTRKKGKPSKKWGIWMKNKVSSLNFFIFSKIYLRDGFSLLSCILPLFSSFCNEVPYLFILYHFLWVKSFDVGMNEEARPSYIIFNPCLLMY